MGKSIKTKKCDGFGTVKHWNQAKNPFENHDYISQKNLFAKNREDNLKISGG
jgi:hypothetical protein